MEPVLAGRRERALDQLEESIDCRDAELAVSLELDGVLSGPERLRLLSHLWSCHECGAFALGQEAQRAALRTLAAVPLPPGLKTFSPERKFRAAPASPT